MKSLKQIPAVMLLAAACTLSLSAAAQQQQAQASDNKRAMAVRLAQQYVKSDIENMTSQLTGAAVQPVMAKWLQQLDANVPPAKQKDVADKLDVELRKYSDNTYKAIEAQVGKAAESALVPLFMEKLSEDELKTIVTYMESSAAAKVRSIGEEASTAWVEKVIGLTRASVEGGAKAFDAAATKILDAATAAAPAKK
ncbi:MAG: hypothetical protein LBP52_08305 [Burkholderiaceae bacterium]|nr:hypothetical protein [Burkholderiaceae bacterium]